MKDDIFDVVIVGAGPAGTSAALNIARASPAASVLLIDKAHFSRFKLCAGGLTRRARLHLRELGLSLPPNSYWVEGLELRFPTRTLSLPTRNWAAVTTRIELDNYLLDQVRLTTSTEIREGEELLSCAQNARGVTLNLTSGTVRTQMVVGADGAHGITRRHLNLSSPRAEMRALEVTLNVAQNPGAFKPNRTIFDFRYGDRGLNGYTWQFHGPASASRVVVGVGHSVFDPGQPNPPIREMLNETVQELGLPTPEGVLGHHVRWYGAGYRYSAPRFILVGDAAGTDPLWGEGITSALEFGQFAAGQIQKALKANDFSFSSYDADLRTSYLGRMLRMKYRTARLFYGGRTQMTPLVTAYLIQEAYTLARPLAMYKQDPARRLVDAEQRN